MRRRRAVRAARTLLRDRTYLATKPARLDDLVQLFFAQPLVVLHALVDVARELAVCHEGVGVGGGGVRYAGHGAESRVEAQHGRPPHPRCWGQRCEAWHLPRPSRHPRRCLTSGRRGGEMSGTERQAPEPSNQREHAACITIHQSQRASAPVVPLARTPLGPRHPK